MSGSTHHHWTRRSFLKASLVSALALVGRPVWAQELTPTPVTEGRLTLYNTHTHERLDVTYRQPSGEYDAEALNAIDQLLRCHYTNKVTKIDPDVIEFVSALDKRLGGGNEIHVISGFRSPEYNRLLRRTGRRVARHSLHQFGKAIDLRIPGVGLREVRKTALALRHGGVGYYPRRGFVHVDSGQFRYW
ncbi:Peptidase M15 [Candidatus Methylomirabilis lanthanidiphila]|uniref:Murein endopeptidase K n=1 Tax=Candidatus Methylomirabilis lanthanidiphila TaxID=2211376 RepID=A0A564ZFR1_9BACT|nr:DUF882 domain-containing protein [Candidatus Methylomirabilis lanthanidiphila]VUZ83993.1 Peptidase M15 [Candidatus Methylomirabilis lanthanidiphila]